MESPRSRFNIADSLPNMKSEKKGFNWGPAGRGEVVDGAGREGGRYQT